MCSDAPKLKFEHRSFSVHHVQKKLKLMKVENNDLKLNKILQKKRDV